MINFTVFIKGNDYMVYNMPIVSGDIMGKYALSFDIRFYSVLYNICVPLPVLNDKI